MDPRTFLAGRLVVVVGDITKSRVDAIVNAANSSLMGGGGVDGAIHRAGGPRILEQCRKIRKLRFPNGLPAGEAVETTAGSLPARYVIHTVGPVWHGGGSGEARTLANCYSSSLNLAEKLGLVSIAFPAISTGVYGYPKDKASVVAWTAISEFVQRSAAPQEVTLVFYSEEDARAFVTSIGQT